MDGAPTQASQGGDDIFTAQPTPREIPINQGGYGLLKKSPGNRFLTEVFDREVTSFPFTLFGYRNVALDESELARLRPHLAEQAKGQYIPALQRTGNPNDIVTIDVLQLTDAEVEGWSRFNFDTSFDRDGGYGGGFYDYEVIDIISPRWERMRLRLDIVPEGYGEEIDEATREGIAADPELRSILATDLREKVADVREERKTRPQTPEGAAVDSESEISHPRREQF
ncbi:MAG: hypothetical protein HY430_02310 [Candidatus Levybacteria bacterium]|nr:hypothetical protein [Candidatus Levybacteria bacterium]